ncbi:MAG: hypothetical protein ACLFRI_05970 [Candidatus Izemoplasmataceae bacterium]
MDQNNHAFVALLFSIASLLLYIFSIITTLMNPLAANVTGFQLFVTPLALLGLFFSVKGNKEKMLYDNEKKRLKQAFILSIIMIVLPVITFFISLWFN